MKYIKGPDFPTGGIICGVEGIKNYFTTGKGSLKLRGRIGVEEMKGNREQLVITEIPFNVNRAGLEEQIAALVNDKVITEISAMRNESDEHCRLVIELKREGNPKVEKWGILIRSEARLTGGRYALTERQVDEILNLRLYQLTGLEIDKIDREYKALLETIKDLLDILAKESRVMTIIKKELQEIK